MRVGAKVIINREGDIADGHEGIVLDPLTFDYRGPLVPVKVPYEYDDGTLATAERFYSVDALEVVS